MANVNSPFGFRPFGHRDGSAPTMGLERRFINSSDANSYFTGDPVAQSSGAVGVLSPYFGSSVAPVCTGIFAGCEYYNPNVGRVVWSPTYLAGAGPASSSPVTAYIISDPEMQFLVQASSAGIGSSMVGTNLGILAAQSSLGNTLSGISNVTISSTQGILAGSSLPFRLVDVYSNFGPPGVNGTDNSSAYNIVVVAPNNWDRKQLTAVST